MATDDRIPDYDPDTELSDFLNDGWDYRFQKAQYDNLLAETALAKEQKREIGQRIWIRWLAVLLSTAVVGAMFYAFYHIQHQIFGFRYTFMQTGAMIALVVAPVVSISGITIALLFGVFRGYKDADAAAASAAVAASVTAAKGS